MKPMLAIALALCAVTAVLAQDHPPARASMDAQLVTSNAFVQVLRVSIPPRGKTPMHDVTPRVVVWLSDAHFVDRFADGSVREETRKAGDAEWVSARQHAAENLSDAPMQFVAIVLTGTH